DDRLEQNEGHTAAPFLMVWPIPTAGARLRNRRAPISAKIRDDEHHWVASFPASASAEDIEPPEPHGQHLFVHICCSYMNRPPRGFWQRDDVRFFLAVARASSLSGAARAVGGGPGPVAHNPAPA